MKNKVKRISVSLLAAALCFGAASPVSVLAENATEEEAPYVRGTLTADGYESEWLNLRYTPTPDMVMSTEEEIAATMDVGADVISDSTGQEVDSSDAAAGTEMMAYAPAGFPNVSLMTEEAVMDNMTPDQYLNALKTQLDATGLGYEYNDEIVDIEIGGKEFRRLDAGLSYAGTDVLQTYCITRQGDYFVALILSYSPDTIEQAGEILDSFTALDAEEEPAEETEEKASLFDTLLESYKAESAE